MAIVFDSDAGTITGLSVGGLPDGIVDAGTLATDSVTAAKIAANSVDSAELIDGAVDDSHMASISGRKNMIINGAMQIDQRATSKTGVTSTGYHTLDRWKLDNSGLGTFTMSRSADAPSGFYSSLKMDCTTAYGSAGGDDFNAIHQDLESYNGVSLGYGTSNAKSLTVSFWVKCSQTGTLQFNLLHYASSTRQISATYTINTANTWEKKTITFAGDTSQASDNDNSKGLVFEWFLASGTGRTSGGSPQTSWGAYALNKRNAGSTISIGDSTSDTWQITGVQAEIGSTATEFEHRSYGEELALCQRYFEKLGNPDGVSGNVFFGITSATNATSARGPRIDFKVTKRATPTIALTGSLYYLSGPAWQSTAGWETTTQFIFGSQTTTGGVAGTAYTLSTTSGAGNYITADAEL